MVCRGSTFHEGSLLGLKILVTGQPVVLFTLLCAGMAPYNLSCSRVNV